MARSVPKWKQLQCELVLKCKTMVEEVEGFEWICSHSDNFTVEMAIRIITSFCSSYLNRNFNNKTNNHCTGCVSFLKNNWKTRALWHSSPLDGSHWAVRLIMNQKKTVAWLERHAEAFGSQVSTLKEWKKLSLPKCWKRSLVAMKGKGNIRTLKSDATRINAKVRSPV